MKGRDRLTAGSRVTALPRRIAINRSLRTKRCGPACSRAEAIGLPSTTVAEVVVAENADEELDATPRSAQARHVAARDG